MRRRGTQNCPRDARTPAETKIRELSGRKSPQKRAIRRRAGNVRFAETGWWRMQSGETGLQCRNREFFENSRPEQAFGETSGCELPEFARDFNQLHHRPR